MTPLTLFDARNAATVRRAMQDAAQRGMPVVFGERVRLTLYNYGWQIDVRAYSGDMWTFIAAETHFDDAIATVTHYARNLEG